jgi:hypothetical protein
MTVVRTSDKHGAVRDDELKEELAAPLRAGHSTRAEPWREPELEPEDRPDEDELIERRRAEEAGRTRGGAAAPAARG